MSTSSASAGAPDVVDPRALIQDFLSQSIFAVAGYSRKSDAPANAIYEKLKRHGYTVYAVNPRYTEIDTIACYPDLKSLPDKPDVVMACTPPAATLELALDCKAAGVPRIWMHRSLGQGSYSREAVEYCAENGITCLPGGCPMMVLEPDIAHRCMHFLLKRRIYRVSRPF